MPLSDALGQSPTDRGVFATLPGHGGLVTCVEFIDDNRLLSADDTGSMRLWRKLNNSVRTKLYQRLAPGAELSHCTGRSVGSITEYSGTYKKHFCVMFVCTNRMHRDRKFRLAPEGLETRRTGCAPPYPTLSTSRIRPVDDLQEVETISMRGRYPLSLALAKLPQADGGNYGFPLLVIVLTTLHLRSSDTRCWEYRQPHSHLYAVRKCCMP